MAAKIPTIVSTPSVAHDAGESKTLSWNEGWVRDHLIALDRMDVQKTFEYVAKHHPYRGMADAFQRFPTIDQILAMPVKQMANYADAVTVCCFNVLGAQAAETPQNVKELNATSLANVAYISIFHSDPATRIAVSKILLALKIAARPPVSAVSTTAIAASTSATVAAAKK